MLIESVNTSAKKTPGAAVIPLSKQILDAWNKSANAKLIVSTFFRSTPKIEDKIRKVWVDQPGKSERSFTKASEIKKSEGSKLVGRTGTDKVVLQTKEGLFFLLDPNNFVVQ